VVVVLVVLVALILVIIVIIVVIVIVIVIVIIIAAAVIIVVVEGAHAQLCASIKRHRVLRVGCLLGVVLSGETVILCRHARYLAV